MSTDLLEASRSEHQSCLLKQLSEVAFGASVFPAAGLSDVVPPEELDAKVDEIVWFGRSKTVLTRAPA